MRNAAGGIAAVGVALLLVGVAAVPSGAWSFRASVDRTCTVSGVQLTVHFANTESKTSQGMTVSATDTQTGKSVTVGAVAPGKSGQGTIDTALQSVKAGKVRVDLAWVSDPKSHDQQLLSYGAFGCDPPPAVPEGLNGWTLAAIVGGVVGVGSWRRSRTGRRTVHR
jgi:hypothetical protein